MKSLLAPFALSIVLATSLIVGTSTSAQATTDPGGGGGNPCNMSVAVTKPTSGTLKFAFTLVCSKAMSVLSHGVTISDEKTGTTAITSKVCRLVPANTKCTASVTIANPSGSQTFDEIDEYYTTFYTVDSGLHTFRITESF